jgi:hypothetical protein
MPRVDPIVVSGRSCSVQMSREFKEDPFPTESENAKSWKFKHTEAKIESIEITSLENGEKKIYSPKDGKCEIKINFAEVKDPA